MGTSRRLAVLLPALALGAAWLTLRATPTPTPSVEGVLVSGPTATARSGASAGAPEDELSRWHIPAAARGPRPSVLQGTDVDGSLTVDVQGHFVPTSDSVRLFEYFFLAAGTEPLEVIRGRIALEILSRLAPPAEGEAIELLDRWLALALELQKASESGELPAEPQARLDTIRLLRRRALGSELAEVLFRDDEILGQLEVDTRAVQLDATLTPAQKEARIEDLESRLPEPLYRVRREATAPARLYRQVEAMRAAGATDAEVFAVREREFGAAAAERLRDLDERQRVFDARYREYAERRDALVRGDARNAPALEAMLEALRVSVFPEDDLAEVRALDAERGFQLPDLAGVPGS